MSIVFIWTQNLHRRDYI